MLKHVLSASALTLIATGALAQTETTAEEVVVETEATANAAVGEVEATAGEVREDVVSLDAWNYEDVYAAGGIRAEELLDADVYGVNGDELADVEDVIMDGQNAVALVVETGGLWDIGDTHIAVPWDEVEFRDGGVYLPVSEENFEQYDFWGEEQRDVVGPDISEAKVADDGNLAVDVSLYRLSNLIDDYVTAGDSGYGYIDDVILNRDGSIEAVVTMARGGYYATPYYGPAWGYRPTAGAYNMGYSRGEVENMETFDYSRVEGDGWF